MKTLFICALWVLTMFCTLGPAQACNPNIVEVTPSLRFTVHDNGVVTDLQTGLMWKRCPEGQSGVDCSTGSEDLFDWRQALERAEVATDADHNDWRLPNVKELASIVETQCGHPSINLSIFPGTQSSRFWSSTAVANNVANSWYVDFGYGDTYYESRTKTYAVRLVRGGQ